MERGLVSLRVANKGFTGMIKEYRIRGYRVHSKVELSQDHLQEFLDLISLPPIKNGRPLGGRQLVVTSAISGLGSIVLKTYRRGGWFGKLLVAAHYLRWGTVRPRQEFELMEAARSKGVSVPEPLVTITQGSLFYRAWLILREIPGERSLADLGSEEPDRLDSLVKQTAEQINLLIEAKICHVDLHPGNVLVDPAYQCHLIDFDKAFWFQGSKSRLRDRYLCRWRRAAIKHKMPEVLSELLCAHLLKKYHD